MGKAGRKTGLSEKLFGEIRKSIISGNDIRETAKVCAISEATLYTWTATNYLNISDKIEGWKRDRKIMLAGKVINEMLEMPVTIIKSKAKDDDEVEDVVMTDPSLVKIKQDTAKFVLETLDKANYSKRTELTGNDGKDLTVQIVNYGNDNSPS